MGSIFGGGKSGGFQAKNAPTTPQLNTAYNNSQNAIAQQNQFVQALQAQNGLGNQQNVFAQQQNLANQFQGIINGTGPNPALAELNQQTGNNAAQQSALMAGQRGAAQNTGLIARQAAQQGGNLQQQAVGQEATLQAQQQVAAMQGLQGQQQLMGNIAQQQVGNAQQGLANLGQQSGQQLATLEGANAQANTTNQQMAAINTNAGNNLLGNLAGAVGTGLATYAGGPIGTGIAAGLSKKAEGGEVKAGPKSKAAQHILMAEGGKVPLLLSPGEKLLDPNAVKAVDQGASPMAMGKEVPGKAKVAGAKNSYANDTVRADAAPGSVVIPRSITQSKDRDAKARAFVEAILSKKSKTLPKK